MRKLLALSLLGVLWCVSWGSADLVTPRKLGPPRELPGLGNHATLERFKGNEPAWIQVSGEADTCLGLYVFDADGNCVAKDDRTTPQSSDDLAVEWIPPDTATYSVEVRNGGTIKNAYEYAVR